jgi:hypothetical protein
MFPNTKNKCKYVGSATAIQTYKEIKLTTMGETGSFSIKINPSNAGQSKC